MRGKGKATGEKAAVLRSRLSIERKANVAAYGRLVRERDDLERAVIEAAALLGPLAIDPHDWPECKAWLARPAVIAAQKKSQPPRDSGHGGI